MMRLALCVVLAGLSISVSAAAFNFDTSKEAHLLHKRLGGNFFNSIPASDSIIWHPCAANSTDEIEKKLLCAKILVPQDWTNRSNTKMYAIAIAKYPALVPEESPYWRGPVLYNPGGPGLDVVYQFRKGVGERLQRYIGANYSLIAFDPRSVGYSEPQSNCFNTVAEHIAGQEDAKNRLRSPLTGGIEALGEQIAIFENYNRRCNEKLRKSGDLRYVGTAAVARDMLKINDEIWKNVGKKPKGLQYLGMSYGTVLGQYFATIFPDRVERLVLDSVVDTDAWQTTYENELTWVADLDASFYSFTTFCALSSNCTMNPKGTETSASIRKRVDAIMSYLKTTPFVPENTAFPINFFKVSSLIYATLYKPMWSFELLSEFFVFMEDTVIAGRTPIKIPDCIAEYAGWDVDPKSPCSNDDDYWLDRGVTSDSFNFVKCGDRTKIEKLDLKKLAWEHEKIAEQSEIGTVQTANIIACASFDDPKLHQAVEVVPESGAKTKYPILFLGNAADPVTPLKNAFNMAKKFPGASVLHVEGVGHPAIASASVCVVRIISTYFNTGKVPELGAKCAVDELPFVGRLPKRDPENAEDEKMFKAAKRLSEMWAGGGRGR